MAFDSTQNDMEVDLLDGLTVYETLEEIIGAELTAKLCDLYGGRTVVIPARPLEGHWLVTAIGYEAAQALTKHYNVGRQGARLSIPKGDQHRNAGRLAEIAKLTDEGVSAGDIALALGITERTVHRIRSNIAKRRAVRMAGRIARLQAGGADPKALAAALKLPLHSVEAILKNITTNSGGAA